ncbi:inositol polyphosphate multikinase [Leptidea sinapis]|uniref:inositol polyphosphate multikinase n=1 Tax=Leptidea sinapis TaxID=189913 RepID=UPI0021301CE7|nr:inositol polyphosphate multikinase [Leptidea sinapis]XP_050664787.1 inositol polyphosphate multikinase [Leptidea sinapis]
MSDVSSRQKQRRLPRRQRSICQVHYNLRPHSQELITKPLPLPFASTSMELQKYGMQVAGHKAGVSGARYTGLLQCSNGTVLKPVLKDNQRREVDFYNRVFSSEDPDLVELRKFVPKYFGCRKFTYSGHEMEYIILEDLSERMLEPCIMDIKIGKRTWDPLASEEKINKEKSKYTQCRQEWGFCIPGYQVYKVDSGRLLKYGKDYGKKLHGHMVTAAIRNYLNGLGRPACRALILQFLSALWALQKWCGRGSTLRLYASSLLLLYDATRLRDCCGETSGNRFSCRPSEPVVRRKSIHSIHPGTGSSFSGQLSNKGPVYRKVNSVPISPMQLSTKSFSPPAPINSPWTEALEKLNHNHSFEHNYEDKLCKIKMNYRAVLDQLSQESPTPNPWGTIKLIDFAHAFFNEDNERTIDDNFKEGIDNLVTIFESLLKETDDQVF